MLLIVYYRRRLRSKRVDPNDTTPLHEQRHLLSQAIQNLSSPQQVYMPGASTFLNTIDPTAISEAPESIKLWLPSHLPPNSCDNSCIADLPRLEFCFRLAQAYDALDLIRCLCGIYQALLMKNQVHISKSQGTKTKAQTLFLNLATKINQATARYHDARIALLRLDPNESFSRWKNDLRDLRREDIHGPSCESDETSESRRQPSWIWQASSLTEMTGINDPELQDVMCIEWCKAVARAEQFREEVELVVEEMRRTLLFFEWAAGNWEQMGEARVGEPIDEGTVVGIKAYAACQAVLYRQLVNVFIQDWYETLEHKSLGSHWLPNYTCPETC